MIELRPSSEEDETLLYELYASTRDAEMSAVDWDQAQKESFLQMQFAAQMTHYQNHFPQATHHIILLEREPIGRIYVDRNDREIRVLDITISPEYRNRGIGSTLMGKLLDEADQSGAPVRLFVWRLNHDALRWYERLGFSQVEDAGAYLLMERSPQ
jgi:ribosomal protein S18 acetylase RimI-like enzyme